uniref:Uncharacterized protein n=1 Tax=Hyaloperonospora arabidopsidis (strain Emoy2) TaxID=559515 RepID=M4BIT1_HYAAE
MIRCGLGLDLDGEWQESQLFPELQMIINNHRHILTPGLIVSRPIVLRLSQIAAL